MSIPHNTTLLIEAAVRGDAVEVQRLIPLSNPKARGSLALYSAAIFGHAQCVELLIPVSDPKSNNALQMAARNGHAQCVELLIPLSEPKADNSAALMLAAEYGRTQCVELLYPVSEPIVVLKKLQHDYPKYYNKWGQLQDMVEAERVQKSLVSEVEAATAVKVQRKM